MSDLRKAAEMALEALEWNYGTDLCDIENCMAWLDKMNATIPALRQALAEPEQEPVAWINNDQEIFVDEGKARCYSMGWIKPLYTAPPQKEWVGLTDADIDAYALDEGVTADKAPPWLVKYARDIEAKLKEKNT
jgi:hypothetical protein